MATIDRDRRVVTPDQLRAATGDGCLFPEVGTAMPEWTALVDCGAA